MEDQKYKQAQAKVKRLKGFHSFLGVYVVLNIALFVIDYIGNGRIDWAYWPLLGLTIALAMSAYSTFGTGILLGQNWEERKIQEYMEEDSGEGQ